MAVVTVVGSANVDQVFRVERIPSPGETVLAQSTSIARGGKGQNQVVAAARAGATTMFIACVGSDAFGQITVTGLKEDGVDAARIRRTATATGTAMIAVEGGGENTIIVSPGANGELADLTSEDIDAIEASAVLLMQLEIPIETVLAASKVARAGSTITILNAAPIRDVPLELLELIDILIVNEHEAASIANGRDLPDLARVVPLVIVTLGARGAIAYRADAREVHVGAPRVVAVDATGAGDTFCGALAAALAEGLDTKAALEFAVVAASLSVESHGAVPSIPRRGAILEAMARAGD